MATGTRVQGHPAHLVVVAAAALWAFGRPQVAAEDPAAAVPRQVHSALATVARAEATSVALPEPDSTGQVRPMGATVAAPTDAVVVGYPEVREPAPTGVARAAARVAVPER